MTELSRRQAPGPSECVQRIYNIKSMGNGNYKQGSIDRGGNREHNRLATRNTSKLTGSLKPVNRQERVPITSAVWVTEPEPWTEAESSIRER